MEKLTNQTFFDLVWERAKDPRKSINGNRCRYRSDSGLCCFVGAAIPEKMYDPNMEAKDSNELMLWAVIDNSPLLPVLEGVDKMLMRACQKVHDWNRPETWQDELRSLAGRFNLRVPA